MRRVTLSTFILLLMIITVTTLSYSPRPYSNEACEVGAPCSKPNCCSTSKKVCGENCTKTCCVKK